MGSKSERKQYPQFEKLRVLDYCVHDGLREFYFYREAERILAGLKIPNLKAMVLKNAEKFYKYFKHRSRCRGPSVLIPVSIYITCLESFIFVNRKELSEFRDCTREEFNCCYKKILTKDDNLRLKLLDIDFRQETILNQLIGLRNHFNLPGLFLKVAIEILYEYYNDWKNTKLTVITARIFRLAKDTLKETMKRFPTSQACYWLGVEPSVCCKKNIKI